LEIPAGTIQAPILVNGKKRGSGHATYRTRNPERSYRTLELEATPPYLTGRNGVHG
jgi:hypothetical protein